MSRRAPTCAAIVIALGLLPILANARWASSRAKKAALEATIAENTAVNEDTTKPVPFTPIDLLEQSAGEGMCLSDGAVESLRELAVAEFNIYRKQCQPLPEPPVTSFILHDHNEASCLEYNVMLKSSKDPDKENPTLVTFTIRRDSYDTPMVTAVSPSPCVYTDPGSADEAVTVTTIQAKDAIEALQNKLRKDLASCGGSKLKVFPLVIEERMFADTEVFVQYKILEEDEIKPKANATSLVAKIFMGATDENGVEPAPEVRYNDIEPVCATDLNLMEINGTYRMDDPAALEVHNREANGLWIAQPHSRFKNMSADTFHTTHTGYLDASKVPNFKDLKYANLKPSLLLLKDTDFEEIPKSFDWRTASPECFSGHKIRDQGCCGSCWAFAASGMFSDRYCIQSHREIWDSEWVPKYTGADKKSKEKVSEADKVAQELILSPQHMVSSKHDGIFGCEGGTAPGSMDFIESIGVTTEKCYPYMGAWAYPRSSCAVSTDGHKEKWVKTLAKEGSVFMTNSEEATQIALMTGGPMFAAFDCCKNFANYKQGVYRYTKKVFRYDFINQMGQNKTGFCTECCNGHAVKLIGWGEDEGIYVYGDEGNAINEHNPESKGYYKQKYVEGPVKYWILENSWGGDWGDKGYFKMERGVNMMNMEVYGFYGISAEGQVTYELNGRCKCNGHGEITQENQVCHCDQGWGGKKCEMECSSLPLENSHLVTDCDEHGIPHKCQYSSYIPSKAGCLRRCSYTQTHHPITHKCVARCPRGQYYDESGKCNDFCTLHGDFIEGAHYDRSLDYCKCWIGWGGDHCDYPMHRDECSGHGNYYARSCVCDVGFTGEKCDHSCSKYERDPIIEAPVEAPVQVSDLDIGQRPLPNDPRYNWCTFSCATNWRGDGVCDETCNNKDCEWDDNDCEIVNLKECSVACINSWKGDGICDPECNNAGCLFDKGDCSGSDIDKGAQTSSNTALIYEGTHAWGSFLLHVGQRSINEFNKIMSAKYDDAKDRDNFIRLVSEQKQLMELKNQYKSYLHTKCDGKHCKTQADMLKASLAQTSLGKGCYWCRKGSVGFTSNPPSCEEYPCASDCTEDKTPTSCIKSFLHNNVKVPVVFNSSTSTCVSDPTQTVFWDRTTNAAHRFVVLATTYETNCPEVSADTDIKGLRELPEDFFDHVPQGELDDLCASIAKKDPYIFRSYYNGWHVDLMNGKELYYVKDRNTYQWSCRVKKANLSTTDLNMSGSWSRGVMCVHGVGPPTPAPTFSVAQENTLSDFNGFWYVPVLSKEKTNYNKSILVPGYTRAYNPCVDKSQWGSGNVGALKFVLPAPLAPGMEIKSGQTLVAKIQMYKLWDGTEMGLTSPSYDRSGETKIEKYELVLLSENHALNENSTAPTEDERLLSTECEIKRTVYEMANCDISLLVKKARELKFTNLTLAYYPKCIMSRTRYSSYKYGVASIFEDSYRDRPKLATYFEKALSSNLAKSKETDCSSKSSWYSRSTQKVVDGDTKSYFYIYNRNRGVSSVWWRVNLGASYNIAKITVSVNTVWKYYTKGDFTILVGDEKNDDLSNYVECGLTTSRVKTAYGGTDRWYGGTAYTASCSTKGKFVAIKSQIKDRYLFLQDVAVYAYADL